LTKFPREEEDSRAHQRNGLASTGTLGKILKKTILA
jgi:hypothetical protein